MNFEKPATEEHRGRVAGLAARHRDPRPLLAATTHGFIQFDDGSTLRRTHTVTGGFRSPG